jgi:opacity protein-like surface antigen
LLYRKPQVTKKLRYGLATAVTAALASSTAAAANWEVAPRIEGGYLYNDNYHLELPGGEVDVSGAQADVAVTFRTIDPRTTVEITPRVVATYFPDESDEDSTDYFLSGLLRDETPRRRMGIAADFSQEDVSRSEFPGSEIDGGLGNPDDLDSGRIIQRSRRDLIRVAPYFSYDVSQRYTLDLEARYIDASFDETAAGFQEDFSEASVTAGAAIRLTPRSSLALRGVVSQFDTAVDADAYGAHLEWATDYSPTSRFYIRLGGQRTEPDRGETDSNFIAGIGGRWHNQRNRLFLDLTRTVGPISAGTIVERHQLRFRLDHDISERVTTVLGARVSRNESIEEASTYPTREYAAADAGLEWRMSRQWALAAMYTYRWQEYDDEISDASSNGIMVSLIFEPRRAE